MDTDVLFLKIERLRRLYRSEILTVPVERGDNGTFGLGLSDDNEVLRLHHDANAQVIEPGDQVISVEGVPLGRGPLSRLLAERFAERQAVTLTLSRAEPSTSTAPLTGDVFATLKLLRADGSLLQEYPSDLWRFRPDAAWGACWTLRVPRGVACASLQLQRSLLFTDPPVGSAVLQLDSLPAEELHTAWHGLRPDASRWSSSRSRPLGSSSLAGEVLISVRRYRESSSVSPGGHSLHSFDNGWESADEFFAPLLPEQHAPAPLKPIAEPSPIL